MVHIYDHYTLANYWMLDSGRHRDKRLLRSDMKRANFPTNKATNTARMRELFIRCQRGLLSYERLPSRDLKLFISQRGLPVTPNQKTTVAALRAQLEQADDDATFDRFSDLPPELRQLICTHYFKSLDHPVPSGRDNDLRCQPPITFASHDTRRESLPAFYESCVFVVRTEWYPKYPLRGFYGALSLNTSAFLKGTFTPNFARIKLLDLDLRDLSINLALDSNNKRVPIRFECYLYPRPFQRGLVPAHDELHDLLLSALRTIAVGIATREGPLKLRQSDLKQLYDVARSIIWHV
ncbi:hypothetical protein Q7P35_009514 [Cladosporium inversicolor]